MTSEGAPAKVEGSDPGSAAALLPPPHLAVGARRAGSDRRGPEEVRRALREAVQGSMRGPTALPTTVVQLVDAGAVAGAMHVASALARAARSRERGRAHLSDPGAEFLLYLAGSDQFPESVARAGVGPSTQEVVLVLSPPGPAEELLRRVGLEPDAAVYPRPPTREVMARLGLSPEELGSVPSSRWEWLAVEAGALVDLPRGGGARRSKS